MIFAPSLLPVTLLVLALALLVAEASARDRGWMRWALVARSDPALKIASLRAEGFGSVYQGAWRAFVA